MYKKILLMTVMILQMSYLTSYDSKLSEAYSKDKKDLKFFEKLSDSQLSKSITKSKNRMFNSASCELSNGSSSMKSLRHRTVKKNKDSNSRNRKNQQLQERKILKIRAEQTDNNRDLDPEIIEKIKKFLEECSSNNHWRNNTGSVSHKPTPCDPTSSSEQKCHDDHKNGQVVKGISAYMSAVSIASGVGEDSSKSGIIPPGVNIKFSSNSIPPEYRHLNGFKYDDSADNGVFTSTSGPGDYLVIFGARWQGNQTLVLMVDGEEFDVAVGGYGFINALGGDLVTTSIIVHSDEPHPTFAIANASEAGGDMKLDNGSSKDYNIPTVSASLTVMKLN